MIAGPQVRRYRRDGYLVLRGALDAGSLAAFRAAVDRVVGAWSPAGDSYERILHQIHHPWRRDEEIGALVTSGRLAAMAAALSGMARVAVFLDQILVKPPDAPATIPHQDAPFLSFDDDRSLACWIALDTVTARNGALAYRRGSHRLGPMPRAHLDEDTDLQRLVPGLCELPLDEIEMSPGDLVFHNCRTVHQAAGNRTDRPRRAFSIQYMPVGARYNGYGHEFLKPYAPVIGDELAFPCFAIPPAPE